MANAARYIFVVEHLDPELGPWSALEYKTIAQESKDAECRFILSSVPESLLKSKDIQTLRDAGAEGRDDSIETYFADRKDRICLLDPAAKQELAPSDANQFDVFLFGGILGKGESPSWQNPCFKFPCFEFNHWLSGDDPPRDRTSELRKKGFTGRRLGPKQMTTDTAVRVTRTVVLDQGE